MKSITSIGSILSGLLLINAPVLSQVKNKSIIEPNKEKMENQINEFKEYILLVH
jgi:hypothetical protein